MGACHPAKIPRQGNRDHKMIDWQQKRSRFFQPVLSPLVTTLVAVSVPTGVVTVLPPVTVPAIIHGPAHGRRAAGRNVAYSLTVNGGHTPSMGLKVLPTIRPHHIGHFQGRSLHCGNVIPWVSPPISELMVSATPWRIRGVRWV